MRQNLLHAYQQQSKNMAENLGNLLAEMRLGHKMPGGGQVLKSHQASTYQEQ